MKDVTDQVEFGFNDGESLPLIKCVCGATFEAWDGPILGLESPWNVQPDSCPKCARQFVFKTTLRVFEVEETQDGFN